MCFYSYKFYEKCEHSAIDIGDICNFARFYAGLNGEIVLCEYVWPSDY